VVEAKTARPQAENFFPATVFWNGRKQGKTATGHLTRAGKRFDQNTSSAPSFQGQEPVRFVVTRKLTIQKIGFFCQRKSELGAEMAADIQSARPGKQSKISKTKNSNLAFPMGPGLAS